MHVHYFQHVPFEGPGSIRLWLESRGCQVSGTRLYNSAILPDPDDIDLLVIMGGPMSVNDEDRFPWLIAEKRFVRDIIKKGIPVLGICLGAQIIANALGAPVYPNREKEIGWYEIQAVSSPDSSLFRFPQTAEVFHWHGETFDLPAGAKLLASSEACKHQAFQVGKTVIGLQFHLETTPESARELVANCRHELVPSTYVQSEEDILAAKPARHEAINGLMGQVLSWLHKQRSGD